MADQSMTSCAYCGADFVPDENGNLHCSNCGGGISSPTGLDIQRDEKGNVSIRPRNNEQVKPQQAPDPEQRTSVLFIDGIMTQDDLQNLTTALRVLGWMPGNFIRNDDNNQRTVVIKSSFVRQSQSGTP